MIFNNSAIFECHLWMYVTSAFFEDRMIQQFRKHGLLETRLEWCAIVMWNYHCKFKTIVGFYHCCTKTYRDITYFSTFHGSEMYVLLYTRCSFFPLIHTRTPEDELFRCVCSVYIYICSVPIENVVPFWNGLAGSRTSCPVLEPDNDHC